MTATTRNDAPIILEGEGLELRMKEIGGDTSATFIRFPKGADMLDISPAKEFGEVIEYVKAQMG